RYLAGSDGVGRRLLIDGDGAFVRPRKAEHHVDGGGLACTVGAEERDDLAGFHLEGKVVDGGHRAVTFRQVLKVDCEHGARGRRNEPPYDNTRERAQFKASGATSPEGRKQVGRRIRRHLSKGIPERGIELSDQGVRRGSV